MTNFTLKGGKYIIQDDGKKGLEATFLYFFKQTPEGEKWFKKRNVTKETQEESPDFIFENSAGKTFGLEITNLVIKTDHYLAIAALNAVANKVCQYFKKEKDIALSLTIDVFDKKKWTYRTKKEYLDYINLSHHNPGYKFTELHSEVSGNKIKDAMIAAISKGDISNPRVFEKQSIELSPHIITISYDRSTEPHTSSRVNVEGRCTEDPFDDLQKTIDSKNSKYAHYKEKCDECDLLIVCDDINTGNFVHFTNRLKSHKFVSVFKNVYLLDLSRFNAKTIKLKTNPARKII